MPNVPYISTHGYKTFETLHLSEKGNYTQNEQ